MLTAQEERLNALVAPLTPMEMAAAGTWLASMKTATSKARFSPDELIAELRREMALRRKVFPGLIRKGTLTDAQMHQRIGCLEDVIVLVEAVYAGELAAGELFNRRDGVSG